jgi:hypothetical protein
MMVCALLSLTVGGVAAWLETHAAMAMGSAKNSLINRKGEGRMLELLSAPGGIDGTQT